MDGEEPSIYDSFFDITVSLCQMFTALDPIKLRKYPAHEVFLLMKRLLKWKPKEKDENNSGIIRRPAGDDWF